MTADLVDGVVGRNAELSVFGELLADLAAAGRGRSVLVEGEPGIGKSALLAAGLAAAGDAGIRVLTGTCDELGQRFTLSVFVETLGSGVLVAEPDGSNGPGTAPNPAASSWSAPIVSGNPVYAAVERMAVAVARLCDTAPVVIAVDDLHWADFASLQLWDRLSRATRQLPLLLVGTCRPLPRREEIDRLRQDLQTGDGVVLALNRLAPDNVSALVRTFTGGAAGAQLATRLELAAGNPLYIRELLGVLVRGQAVKVAEGVAELVEDAPGPPSTPLVSLTGAIADRLDILSPATRDVLRTAALLGPDFTVADLSTVAERAPEELAPVVEEAIAGGVVEAVGLRLRFRHGLEKQALYDATPTALRLALHRHAAESLAAAGAPVERVAQLILPALDAADGWEIDWLIASAGRLIERSPQIAAELLEHAVEHTDENDPRQDELEERLGAAAFLLSRHEQTERLARQVLARTRDRSRTGPTLWKLGYTLLRTGRGGEALDLLGPALADPATDPLWRTRLTALQALMLAASGQEDGANAAIERTLAAEAAAPDRLARAYALHSRAMTTLRRGTNDEFLAAVEDALAAIGDDPELADLRVIVLLNKEYALSGADRIDESVRVVGEAMALAERIGAPCVGNVHIQSAGNAFALGRWDDALAEFEVVTELPESTYLPPILHGLVAYMAGHRDDRATADRHLAIIGDEPPAPGAARAKSGWVLGARALTAERAGRPGESAEILSVLLTPEYEQDLTERHIWLPLLTRLALAAGDPDLARRTVEACEAQAERERLPRIRSNAAWCRGLLDGDPEPVRKAVEYNRASGRVLEFGLASEDVAQVLASGGDLDGARAALAQAMSAYADLGAVWDGMRAAARMRPFGIRPGVRGPRRRPQSGWEALTETELRVAELVATGRSNPDIAAQLFLSRRTIDTHVSHILAKLDARSRREIASLAAARATTSHDEPRGRNDQEDDAA